MDPSSMTSPEAADTNSSRRSKEQDSLVSRGQMEAELISMDSGSCGASASSGYGTQKTGQPPHHREKKERVKQCLRELHSLMPEGSKRKGLLGTLQQVVQRMKQMNNAETSDNDAPKTSDATFCTPAPPRAISLRSLRDQMSQYNLQGVSENFRIVMSLNDTIICDVSEDLVLILGYPKDYWLKQSILDFLRKHDLSTFTSKLSQCRALISSAENDESVASAPLITSTSSAAAGGKDEPRSLVNPFYFKLRHYKSLRTGFNLVRPDRFTAFYGRVSIQSLCIANDQTGKEGDDSEPPSAEDYMVIECQPIRSAFREPGKLPDQVTFSTKHTVFCTYSHVDEAGISLLGYLPQDMISSSIFNYYHPKDLPLLFTIYQHVVSDPRGEYTSAPYRMRAHNGDYLLIQTKWVKNWDSITGHHTVIKGPDNCDVFDNASVIKMRTNLPVESPDIVSMEKLIKKLLDQPIEPSCDGPDACPPPELSVVQETLPLTAEASGLKRESGSSSESGLMSTESFLEEAIKRKEKEQDEGSSSGGSISLSEEDLSVLYEGLSYASSIRRYLMSHGSSAEFPKGIQFSQMGSGDVIGSPSIQEPITVDVELPLPARIPSQASSTKALVSEHEREELAPPSPAHEDLGEETHKETTPMEMQDYTPVRLSMNALKAHDKIHEKFFIEKMMKEKAGYLLSQAGSRMLKTLGRTKQKRQIPAEHEADEKMVSTKLMRQDDGKAIPSRQVPPTLQPPFPMTSLETRWIAPPVSTSMAFRLSSLPASSSAFHSMQPQWQQPVAVQPQVYPTPPPSMYPLTSPLFTPSAPVTPNDPISASAVRTNPATSQPQAAMMPFWPIYAQHRECSPFSLSVRQSFSRTEAASMPAVFSTLTGQPNALVSPGFMMGPGMALQPTVVPIPSATFAATPVLPKVMQTLDNADGSPQKAALTPKQTFNSHQGPGPPVTVQSVAAAVDMDFSTDCTDSSLLFLLESSTDPSQNHSAEEEDRGPEPCSGTPLKQGQLNRSRPPPKSMDPPWRQMVNWTRQVQMRYEVQRPTCGDLLKQDLLSLQLMRQPQQLSQQLDDLLSFMSSLDKDSKSQDDDILLMSECALAKYDDSESTDPGSDEAPMKEEKQEEVKMEEEEQCRDSPCSLDSLDSPARPKSTDKLSENEGSDDSNESSADTSSKASSELTLSESRSNEEAASSMKESDNASSSGSFGKGASNLSSESENDSKKRAAVKTKVSMHKKQEYFSKLFVPMRVWYEDNSGEQWMPRDTADGSYQSQQQQPQPQGSTRSCAQDLLDCKQQLLPSIGQPDLVRMQMSCLLEDLQASEADSLSSSSLSSRDDALVETSRTNVVSQSPNQNTVSMEYEAGQYHPSASVSGMQSTTSGFSSMSNADSSGRGNSSSGGDKPGANSDKNGSSKESASCPSHAESSSAADPSQSSNSDPDDKAARGICRVPPLSCSSVQPDVGGLDELPPGPSGQAHRSGTLPPSVIEKLDSVMSVFSLKGDMDAQYLGLLQE
ncbi:hypothetical protein CAPTEDRAFT_202301 [Capitella teleta]|uniref:PAS domain-containing protein n=1 Tax=Capitella teleta TaxID=283909 RepID=R7UY34_CAPTE|nr:hypothetical protein CAPTEDRAFT_202301 [Capitella teleta]|eukprot:ELU11162.1 hypothetical protein CAPTEDRAFT_202301 [Capitella teleta]